MAILEVVLRSVMLGQQCVNRWNYVSSGDSGSVSKSFALVEAMGFVPSGGEPPADTIMDQLKAMTDAAVTFLEVQARDVYSVTDFYTLPFPAAYNGEKIGEASAPFVAFGFKTNRVRADIGRGTKRFVGIPEDYLGDGGILNVDGLAAGVALAGLMSEILLYPDVGDTISFTPAVVKKIEYVTPSGKKAYKYRDTEVLQLENTAFPVAWEAYTQARSQVSRQIGRGG
jgi:hypothetical protein